MLTDSPRSSHLPLVDAGAANAATDWLALLWHRKLTMILVAVAILVMGLLYYKQATPIYQSTAQLLLIKNEAELPISGAGGQVSYEDTLSTHMILIRSPLIVRRAIEKYRLGTLPSLKGVRDPQGAIISSLDAVRGGTRDAPDPNVISLAYRGTHAHDCAAVLDAVIQSYQEFLGETYENFNGQTVELISRAKDELDRQLSEREAKYRQFRDSSPHLLMNPNGQRANIHELRMVEIEKARAQQLLTNTELKARIEAIDAAVTQGGHREALNLLAKKAEASQGARTPREFLEHELFESLLEEQLLLEDFGNDHPQVVAVRKKLDMLREHLGRLPAEGVGEPADFLAVYLDSLRQEWAVGQQQLNELHQLFAAEQEAAKSLAAFQLADETHRSEIARTQQLFDGVIKRLEEITLVKDHGGIKTQLISPPGSGSQVAPNLPVVLVLSLALAMMAGASAAYVVERTDQRFRSPEDLRLQLGLPIVGHIPVISGASEMGSRRSGTKSERHLDESLCTYHQPDHAASEAYRAVRTALYFSSRGAGHRVVQITSPTPGDGKTTLSANLAISAAHSGKKVLLIEGDFRRPRLAELFLLDEQVGVTSVITAEADVNQAIRSTAIDGLSVMPCGPRPDNPSELLTSPRFQDLLHAVRDRFDLILVDTPPLLAVTDPAVVAPRVDTVVLVVSLGRNIRQIAQHASEILDHIGANVLGVVVNRFDGSSSYASRRYSYRYRYGYRYGYSYRNDRRMKKTDGAKGESENRNGRLSKTPLHGDK